MSVGLCILGHLLQAHPAQVVGVPTRAGKHCALAVCNSHISCVTGIVQVVRVSGPSFEERSSLHQAPHSSAKPEHPTGPSHHTPTIQMTDATFDGVMDVEVRTLGGESMVIVLNRCARTADLRSSLVDSSKLFERSTFKLFAEGRVLENDEEPLPVPEGGQPLVVHVAPTMILDSLDPLDRAILLDDDGGCVAPESPSSLAPPQQPAVPLPQEQLRKRRCLELMLLLICASLLVGALSGTILAHRSQHQHEAATMKMAVAHQEPRTRRSVAASHANVSLESKRMAATLASGRPPRLRALAWSQSVGSEEANPPTAFSVGIPAPPTAEAATSRGSSFAWSSSPPPPPPPPPPLHVAMRPKWQVMVLPLITGLLALVKPIGQSLFITLMALARRLLPNEGCGLVRRFLTKRGLAFGADAEELCSAKRM